jgi:hypothetical protein
MELKTDKRSGSESTAMCTIDNLKPGKYAASSVSRS